jgi:hypothetical protein
MAHEARRLVARRQLPEQRLGPEVLVDVDSFERQRTDPVKRFSEPLQQYATPHRPLSSRVRSPGGQAPDHDP